MYKLQKHQTMQKTLIEKSNGDNMYFTNISDMELSQYHEKVENNFNIPLMEALTSGLFKIETMVTNSIYKVYPLFYCTSIVSNNPNDKILDNKCIICEKKESTFFTFKSNIELNSEIQIGWLFGWGYGYKLYVFDMNTNLPIQDVEVVIVVEGVTYRGFTDENGVYFLLYPTHTTMTSIQLVYKGETVNVW